MTVKVGRFPFIGNGKAIALGEAEGMIKTVFDAKTGELLGAHMVGAEVTELIQGYVIGRTLETTEEDLMNTVFPHPTLSRDDARSGAGRLRSRAAHLMRSLNRSSMQKDQPGAGSNSLGPGSSGRGRDFGGMGRRLSAFRVFATEPLEFRRLPGPIAGRTRARS